MKTVEITTSASSLFRHRRPTLPAGVGRRCFPDMPGSHPSESGDPILGDGRATRQPSRRISYVSSREIDDVQSERYVGADATVGTSGLTSPVPEPRRRES